MADVWVIVGPGSVDEQTIPVRTRLHVGRECRGIDPESRLLLEDPAISRDHLQLRVDGGVPLLVDSSSNGTRINGRRVERGEPSALVDGDEIVLGGSRLLVRVLPDPDEGGSDVEAAYAATTLDPADRTAAVVVGDLVAYTTLTERYGGAALAAATDLMFGPLRELVIAHGGMVSNYAGDAILAAWEVRDDPGTVARALGCALAMAECALRVAPDLELRDSQGGPLRMGWATTVGPVAVSRPSPGRETVHGDPVILAFRLSALAGREGRPMVLVADDVLGSGPPPDGFGDTEEITVKGRASPARVRGWDPTGHPPGHPS